MSEDGHRIAASAREGDPSNVTDAGYTRVFEYNGHVQQNSTSTWRQLGGDITGEVENEQSGKRLAMSANGLRLAVSGQQWKEQRGRILVFDYLANNDTWVRKTQALEGKEPEDWFGTGLALSPEGKMLAVGADGVDTNGNESGWVGVYLLKGDTWTPYGDTILGENEFDRLGTRRVSLSDDGRCLAIGGSHFRNRTGVGYLYQWNHTWKKVAEVTGDNPGDRFGGCTAVSGDCKWVAWAASQKESFGPGYVKVYLVQDLLDGNVNA